MRRPHFNATRSLAVLTVLALAGWLSVWYGTSTLGQQAEEPEKVDPAVAGATEPDSVSGSKFVLQGNLHVKYHLPEGARDPAPQKAIEDVSRIVFFDEWVVLRLTEDEEEATLVIPREKLIYLKAWDVKEEE